MNPAEQQLAPNQVLEKLNDKEQASLRLWYASHKPEISPATSARMFTLFLNGNSCEQIQQLNTGFSLPQIVYARVKHEWDRQRDEYLKDLLDLTRIRVMQTTLEATNLVADLLTVAQVEFGERLKRYMLSRDPNDLSGLSINSLRDLKEMVTLFQTLTGQDNKPQKHTGEVIHTHRAAYEAKSTPSTAASDLRALVVVKPNVR